MKSRFQSWYAEEVQKQLANGTAIHDVKIATHTYVLKPKSANCLIGSLDSIENLKVSSMDSKSLGFSMH